MGDNIIIGTKKDNVQMILDMIKESVKNSSGMYNCSLHTNNDFNKGIIDITLKITMGPKIEESSDG